MTPLPLFSIHSPVPATGILPDRVVEFVQRVSLAPASETVASLFIIITSSNELLVPENVHLKIVSPGAKFATDVLYKVGLAIVAVPLIIVHIPVVPPPGIFPLRVV